MESFDKIKEFIRKQIIEHRKCFNKEEINDLVDLYLAAEANEFKDTGNMEGN